MCLSILKYCQSDTSFSIESVRARFGRNKGLRTDEVKYFLDVLAQEDKIVFVDDGESRFCLV